jgi:hypothetical protein
LGVIDEVVLAQRFRVMSGPGRLDERQLRLLAGSEALLLGRGGQAAVIRASGLSHETVRKGMREARAAQTLAAQTPAAGLPAASGTMPSNP